MKKEIKVLFKPLKQSDNNPLFASSYFIATVEKIEKKFNNQHVIVTNNCYTEENSYEVAVAINYQDSCAESLSNIDTIIESTKEKYPNIQVMKEDIPELIIEKAKMTELNDLKIEALKIVKNMNENGLQLWNDYYPAEEFEDLIRQNQLYVCKENHNIVGFFALFDEEQSSNNFVWKNDHSKYLEMFAISVDYLHKKYGYRVLIDVIESLKEEGYDSLKLIVFDQNIAAISLYKKIGFQEVPGHYVFVNEFRKEEPPRNMIGMEFNIKE